MGVILKIKNRKFDFFNKTEVVLKYANIASTFSFSAYFDSESSEHKRLFKPLTYPPVTVETENGIRLITGVVLGSSFSSEPKQKLASISGYSKTGVLMDCPIPVSEYPIQFDGLSLFEISQKLCKPFGISVILGSNTESANDLFDEITSTNTKSIAQFLSETAAQKNLFLTHSSRGNLFIKSTIKTTRPKATFEYGVPGNSLSMSVSGQGMHNEITVQNQASISGNNASEETVRNPFVSAFRPTTKSQSSGTDTDTVSAVQNALVNEYKKIRLTIKIDRWTWPGTNEIMKPNNIISVHDHDLFLFRKRNFFVEEVALKEDAKNGQTATLKCVIPEVYNGKKPNNIFNG